MSAKKSVWCTPQGVSLDGLAHVTWTHEGNLNKGRLGAKVTARNGVRRFKNYTVAKTFAKRQTLRMGNGTELGIHSATSEDAQWYNVKGGKLIRIF